MLSYAGIPLLLPDPEDALTGILERYQPLEDLRLFGGEPAAVKSSRTATHYDNKIAIGLSLPNWPPMPAMKLNTLYWPTGASRFAYGVFLCDSAAKNKLAPSEGGRIEANFLTFGGDDSDPLRAELYLLPPRPIATRQGNDRDSDLWLLPLVDERYWWQFKSLDVIDTPNNNYTWNDIFGAIALSIPHTLPTVSPDYLVPDPVEINRNFDNPAVLLDALALSVGLRVTRDRTGAVILYNADGAFNVTGPTTAAIQRGLPTIAGDGFSDQIGDMPEKVTVVFRRCRDYHAFCDAKPYTVDVSAPEGTRTVPDTIKLIHSAAFADYTGNYVSDTPTNYSDLNTLAARIALDFYKWQQFKFDTTYQGAIDWNQGGAEHYTEYAFGRRCAGGYEARTRVQSLPADFGVEQQLSQDGAVLPIFVDDTLWGFMATSLAHGGAALLEVCEFTSEFGRADTGYAVTVFDTLLNSTDAAIDPNTRAQCQWDCNSDRWILTSANCQAETGSLP